MAVLGDAAEAAIAEAGPENFAGKVVIDAMNPLDFSAGFPPKLSICGEDSLGEHVQRALPDAKVVKAFNTIGSPYYVDPSFSEGAPTMLIAGNDEDAKPIVGEVLADFGWSDVVDIGGIEGSRELEAICSVWVKIGAARNAWDHGFKLLGANIEDANQEEQRMQDDVSRLVGIDRMVVTGVLEVGRQLEIEVECTEEVACCRWCARASLLVKDRAGRAGPGSAGRWAGDVSAVAQASVLVRGVRADVHRDTSGAAVAAAGQRPVSCAPVRALSRGGGAHAEVARDERTSRYQVYKRLRGRWRGAAAPAVSSGRPRRLSLDEAHHRRGRELATVVSDLDRRRVIEVVPGCSRKVDRALAAGHCPPRLEPAIEVVSIDPYGGLPAGDLDRAAPRPGSWCDRFHLVRGANTALDAVRRERQRDAHARRKRPKGTPTQRPITSAGAPSSTRPDTGCSKHPSVSAHVNATDSVSCSNATR